jgi:hypothetical protein
MPKGKGRPKKREDKVTVKGDKGTSKKLRFFQTSAKANRDGAAFMGDGSILRRAESLEAPTDESSIRARYGYMRGKGEPEDYGVKNYAKGGEVCRGGGKAMSGTKFRGVR